MTTEYDNPTHDFEEGQAVTYSQEFIANVPIGGFPSIPGFQGDKVPTGTVVGLKADGHDEEDDWTLNWPVVRWDNGDEDYVHPANIKRVGE